ncbi:YcxB family protein [Bartonella rochalimae]|uniref:YcxB family protein n=1 Tax=Bartonella rochalimae TaxID=395923 RepID=UPI003F683C1F
MKHSEKIKRRVLVFELDQKKAIEAQKAHCRRYTRRLKTFLHLLILWLICVSVYCGFLIMIEGQNWTHYWGKSLIKTACIYAAIICVIWALNYYVLVTHKAYRLVKNNQQIGLKQVWQWDDHALAIRNSYIQGTYPFRLFYDWHEYPNFLALYISEEKFNILPKAIMTKEQLADLRTILSREITSPKKRL